MRRRRGEKLPSAPCTVRDGGRCSRRPAFPGQEAQRGIGAALREIRAGFEVGGESRVLVGDSGGVEFAPAMRAGDVFQRAVVGADIDQGDPDREYIGPGERPEREVWCQSVISVVLGSLTKSWS